MSLLQEWTADNSPAVFKTEMKTEMRDSPGHQVHVTDDHAYMYIDNDDSAHVDTNKKYSSDCFLEELNTSER